jgi:hypothetical protein
VNHSLLQRSCKNNVVSGRSVASFLRMQATLRSCHAPPSGGQDGYATRDAHAVGSPLPTGTLTFLFT